MQTRYQQQQAKAAIAEQLSDIAQAWRLPAGMSGEPQRRQKAASKGETDQRWNERVPVLDAAPIEKRSGCKTTRDEAERSPQPDARVLDALHASVFHRDRVGQRHDRAREDLLDGVEDEQSRHAPHENDWHAHDACAQAQALQDQVWSTRAIG